MRIGILGWDHDEPESVGLFTIGGERGHDLTLFTLDDVHCRHTGDVPETYALDFPVRDFDLIISRAEIRADRIQADYERYALLCEVAGVTVLDPLDAYFSVENKMLTLQRLAAAGLPIAPTVTCVSVADVAAAVDAWGAVVIKPSFGYGGTDVEKIVDPVDDQHVVKGLLKKYQMLLCQPFLPHPDGDFRITVVGDQAPLNFQRVPAADDWRANTMRGASVRNAEAPPELIEMAKRAARAVGITIAGLDFVPTEDGYRILEINNTPGWYASTPEEQRHIIGVIFDMVESGAYRALDRRFTATSGTSAAISAETESMWSTT